jgi:hypothetical protein
MTFIPIAAYRSRSASRNRGSEKHRFCSAARFQTELQSGDRLLSNAYLACVNMGCGKSGPQDWGGIINRA